MLLSLLFLIILAIMAFQSQKIVLSAVVFGLLKGIASCFYIMAESEQSYGIAIAIASGQLIANGLLGLGIAYLVVKRSQDWRFMFLTMILSIMTFLTTVFEPVIVA